jgi:hypothetical protein
MIDNYIYVKVTFVDIKKKSVENRQFNKETKSALNVWHLLTTSGTRPYNMCTEEFSDLKMKKK